MEVVVRLELQNGIDEREGLVAGRQNSFPTGFEQDTLPLESPHWTRSRQSENIAAVTTEHLSVHRKASKLEICVFVGVLNRWTPACDC